MIEAALLLAVVGTLTAAGAHLWRRIGGPPRHRAVRLSAVALGAGLLVGASAYELMNARGIQVCGAIVPRVDTSQPLVALTFDDGPTPPYTAELLRALDEKGVKATFFVTGANLEKFPELAQTLVREGHELGNHSYSHQRMILKDYAFVRSELERTDELIRKAGHAEAIHFRSPYAKKLFLLPLYLWRTGKTNVIADVEPDAALGTSAEQMVEIARADVRPGSILILHAENRARQESLRAVPGIVAALQEQGYRFVTVSQLLAAPLASD